MVKLDKRTWKKNYFEKLKQFSNEFNKCVVIGVDNIQSKQMQQVRAALRGRAELLMGKNTMIRKCMREIGEDKAEFLELLPSIVGNIGFVFTDMDLIEVREVLESYKVQSQAKAGVVAPVDVVIPAGSTGMGPEKTSFFQALNLPTKITKGSIEILNDVTVVHKGDKVGLSEAKLLNMLSISPFWYNCEINMIYDNGSIYPPQVLDITMDVVRGKIMNAVLTSVAPLSLALGIPNPASAPHMILNAFKNCLAVAVATDFTFKEAEAVKAYLADPSAFASAAPAAGGGGGDAPAAAAAAAPPPAEEESEEEMEMGLFD
eukprot:m.428905 g.428905  ORF g.428905 m.428905 type:complete len:317 (-) comp16908_c0_seq1:376-1326(-)